MNDVILKELFEHRLEQAIEELEAGKVLYKSNLFKSANSILYNSIFHSMKAVLALEPIDFKRHKDVIAYFNKNYVRTDIFPKKIGHMIAEANSIREDSDYDDEFVVNPRTTEEQIKTAKELLKLVKDYISKI